MITSLPDFGVMTASDIDAFPLGVVKLDHGGIIRIFNRAEQRFVNRSEADALGKNYFREVAPCTAVRNFEGRFNAFVETPAKRCETFSFFYPFAAGHKQVMINLVKSDRDDASVYIVTEVLPVEEFVASHDRAPQAIS